MPAPQPKSSVADYVVYNLYVLAKLEARKATAHLAEVLQVDHDGLMATLGVRNKAHNAFMKEDAKVDVATEDLVDTLEPLMNDAASSAVFKSKDHSEFKRIFVKTAKQYENLPQRDQPTAFADLKKELLDEDTPAALKKAAKPFLDAYDVWVKAREAVAKAADALDKATKKVAAAKIACLNASSRLRGKLQDLFPRQPKMIARFFPKGAQPPLAKDAPVTPDAGQADAKAPVKDTDAEKTPG